jgi:hypothetical protein
MLHRSIPQAQHGRDGERRPEAASKRNMGVCPMLDQPVANKFAHVKPGDTPWVGEGLRDFFLYRDLGVAMPPAGACWRNWSRPTAGPRKVPTGTSMSPTSTLSSC